MRIRKEIYQRILDSCPAAPPETGGILGAHGVVIDTVVFDPGSETTDQAVYYPDVEFLNAKLERWRQDRIAFRGLFHTHPRGQDSLSQADIEYIGSIMMSLPSSVTQLYFPIVFPYSHMISFKAINQKHNVIIERDMIYTVP